MKLKFPTNVVVVGGMIAAALVLKRLLRARRRVSAVATTDEVGLGAHDVLDEDMRAVATESGIANVDPEPISHVAGEGIDLDRDIAAHQEIADLHDRLPH